MKKYLLMTECGFEIFTALLFCSRVNLVKYIFIFLKYIHCFLLNANSFYICIRIYHALIFNIQICAVLWADMNLYICFCIFLVILEFIVEFQNVCFTVKLFLFKNFYNSKTINRSTI